MLYFLNSLFSRTGTKLFCVPAITLAALMLSAASARAEELYYDNGTVYSYTGGMEGMTLSVRFTVADPVTVTGVKFWHGVNPNGYDMRIHIWDQAQQEVFYYDYQGDAVEAGWTVVDLSSESIPVLVGDFFVGLERTGSGVSIGFDNSDPDTRSYFGFPPEDYFYELYVDRDYMIRAFVEPENQVQEVSIDIKFCSDPNAFNCKKKGVLPVTIFGSESLPESDIDIDSLELCNATTDECAVNAVVDYSVFDRGDPTKDNEVGAGYCGNRECVLEELVSIDPLVYECVEYQEYLHQDGYDDLDVAFDVKKVKEILTLEDGETDFCDADKGEISAALYIHGYTMGGVEILSVPASSVGIDQLLKQNK